MYFPLQWGKTGEKAELLRNNVELKEMSVFMKNPNNNSVNYWKSLFFKTDQMAGPLNPEWHSKIQNEILVSVPLQMK